MSFSLNGSHYPPEQPGPKSADPDITNRINSLQANGFKVLLTLTGAAAGLYVVFYLPTGIVYVGPFAAMIAIIGFARWIFGFGRAKGATHYEITEKIAEVDNDD